MTKVTSFLILFDLDGTLVDSVPDLAASLNRTLIASGKSPVAEELARTWVGNGAPKLVKRALTGSMDGEPDAEEFKAAIDFFMQDYRENICVHSRLYPTVMETLAALASEGHTLGCVTNKASAFTRPLLNKLSIVQYFKIVVSGDDLPTKKPDPAPIVYALDQTGFTKNRVIMVGDSINDIAAAQNAGVISVGVPYGYNHGQPITDADPDYVVEQMSSLFSVLNGYSPSGAMPSS